jgi:hypothetical protein
MPVMDLEIEGFSATQRTIIGPDVRDLRPGISASNGEGDEENAEPQAMLPRRTLMHYATNVVSAVDSVNQHRAIDGLMG